jgi:hypothetical protein
LSGRDVVPDLRIEGAASDAGAGFLYGFLSSDGADWSPPYAVIRQKMGIRRKQLEPESQESADSRVRTWMVYFRALGLLYESGGTLRVTGAGRRLKSLLDESFREVDLLGREVVWADRWRIARGVIGCLARYMLRNPLTESEYAADVDIFPLWAIWRAMRSLDNKIHWEEFGRVLTKCLRMADLDAAIETIRQGRLDPSYDASSKESMEALFGPRCPDMGDDGDQRDRIIVWLSRAGFKDLLIERRTRDDGYRYLQAEFLPLLDAVLAEAPTYQQFSSAEGYFDWMGSAPPFTGGEPEAGTGDEQLRDLIRQCAVHGGRSILALVGSAGVGKTRLAFQAAQTLADRDSDRLQLLQFHAAFTYEEFIGGLAPNATGGFSPVRGVFTRFNDAALALPESTFVLVIDELSRADLSNVLGELLTYIEYRDRSFYVPSLDADIRVAPNLVIIATMNEKDRSVVNLDDATVRRLRFFPIEPSATALARILDEAGMRQELRDEVVSWFEGLPPDTPFGHGLFVGVRTEGDLFDLWHQQLKFYLRRGGITIYPDSAAIERGYRWRRRSEDTETPLVEAESQNEEREQALEAAEDIAQYQAERVPEDGASQSPAASE